MDEENIPKYDKPRWNWYINGLSVIAYVVGAVGLFIANAVGSWSSDEKVVAAVILVALIVIVPGCAWLIKFSYVVYKRYVGYIHVREASMNYARILKELIVEWQNKDIFDVQYIIFEKNKLYILISKKIDIILKVGDKLVACYSDDPESDIMGLFEIKRVKDNGYYALGEGINPVTLGLYKTRGDGQYPAPVELIAILRKR